jgi:hypothetical protein
MTDEQKQKAKRREYARKWRAANREKVREYSRRWYSQNPDKIREYNHKSNIKRTAARRARNLAEWEDYLRGAYCIPDTEPIPAKWMEQCPCVRYPKSESEKPKSEKPKRNSSKKIS